MRCVCVGLGSRSSFGRGVRYRPEPSSTQPPRRANGSPTRPVGLSRCSRLALVAGSSTGDADSHPPRRCPANRAVRLIARARRLSISMINMWSSVAAATLAGGSTAGAGRGFIVWDWWLTKRLALMIARFWARAPCQRRVQPRSCFSVPEEPTPGRRTFVPGPWRRRGPRDRLSQSAGSTMCTKCESSTNAGR